MKKKIPAPVKDGLVGAAMGASALVPGISGGTIAFIFNVFEKIINAIGKLFSKNFWKCVLVLIPFVVGAILAIGALIIPVQKALENCLFAFICLFGGFIVGSVPGITDEIKDAKLDAKNWIGLLIGFAIATLIGVLSVLFDFQSTIDKLFVEREWYLYLILIVVGMLGAMGFILPGFSGAMLLVVIGFYHPVINLFHFDNFWSNVSLLAMLAVGAVIGIVLCSKLLSKLFESHRRETIIVILGFVLGSIISIFVNSEVFNYLSNGMGKLDMILSPILLVCGLALSYLVVRLGRKKSGEENA